MKALYGHISRMQATRITSVSSTIVRSQPILRSHWIYVFISMIFQLLLASESTQAQWIFCGIPVGLTDRGDSVISDFGKLSADGNGGAYLCWTDHTIPEINVRAQRINSDGYFQWGAYGRQVSFGNGTEVQMYPEILADCNGGGVFIAWEYETYLQIQKLDSSGRPLWGLNGIRANILYTCYGISLALDSTGGVFVASSGWTSTGEYAPWVQHFDAFGNRLWGDGGRVLSNRGNRVKLRCTRVASGSCGSVIACWIETVLGGGKIDRNWTQRLDYDGNALWAPDGMPNGIPLSDTTSENRYWLYTIEDGRGGAFATWSSRNSHDAVVQHVDSSGRLHLGKDGLFHCDGTVIYEMISDGADGVLIGSNCLGYFRGPNEKTGNYYMQRISGDNRLVWDDSAGILVKPGGALRNNGRNICSDGLGGAFIVDGESYIGREVWVQWVDSSRTLRFGDRGIPICQGEGGTRATFDMDATAPGEGMLFWIDTRFKPSTPHGTNCYVAKITTNGVVGIRELPPPTPSSITLGGVYPQPAGSSSMITFSVIEVGDVRLALCDINGRELRVVSEGERPPGTFVVPIESEGLPDGTYFIVASVGQDVKVKKMLVIKR